MKNSLRDLTVSLEFVKKLLALGINPIGGVLWHSNVTEDDLTSGEIEPTWEVHLMPYAEYTEYFTLPAWTKEEMDCMIGGDYNPPHIPDKSCLTPSDLEAARMMKGIEARDYYPDFILLTLQEKESRFYKAADASAAALIWALENKKLFAKDCNNRYLSFYK